MVLFASRKFSRKTALSSQSFVTRGMCARAYVPVCTHTHPSPAHEGGKFNSGLHTPHLQRCFIILQSTMTQSRQRPGSP